MRKTLGVAFAFVIFSFFAVSAFSAVPPMYLTQVPLLEGWTTAIIVDNTDGQYGTGSVQFGSLKEKTLVYTDDGVGDYNFNPKTGTTVFSIPPGMMKVLQFTGTGGSTWAMVVTDEQRSNGRLFRPPIYPAWISPEGKITEAKLVRPIAGNQGIAGATYYTGIAIANINFFGDLVVTIRASGPYGVIAEKQVLLPPRGQECFFAGVLLNLPEDFSGTIAIISNMPVPLAYL